MTVRPASARRRIAVGVIGFGYWGPKLARNFTTHAAFELTAICDSDPQQQERARQLFPGVRLVSAAFEDALAASELIVIATPVATHYRLALAALQADRHVLVEKPLCLDSRDAAHLVRESARRNLVVAVDHTFVYTPAVTKLKELFDRGDLGDFWYYDSVRVNLGMFQHDVDVLVDLAPHDISILDYLLGRLPSSITASGVAHTPSGLVDIAHVQLRYGTRGHAHLHLNWLSPVKVRTILIGGSRRMFLYDDMNPTEKIRVYDKGIDLVTEPGEVYKALISYRIGDMHAPRLQEWEALGVLADELAMAITEGRRMRSDADAALRCVRVLEAAMRSLAGDSKRIEIEGSESP